MTIRIAWGITGAGCWLIESFEILGKLLKNTKISLDLFFSEAGREVSQFYGVFKSPVPLETPFVDKVREIPNFNHEIFEKDFVKKFHWLGINESRKIIDYSISNGQKTTKEDEFDYDEAFNDVIFEIDEGSSFPTSARAANNYYDFVVIGPATGNTVAKIANGIADNLLASLAIMGNKSSDTQVIVIPTDLKIGESKSHLPIMLHSETCKKCSECSALWACKPGAIRRKRGKIRINRLKCIGCLDCVKYCRHGVITFLEEITVNVRDREEKAAKQLSEQEGFKVFETPNEAYEYICKAIKKMN